MSLNREDFTEERIAEITREATRLGVMTVLSLEAREATRRAILAEREDHGETWVFGYGSLMWNPACHVDRSEPALLHGYHRRFCLRTHLGRGTPERPGLTLGLLPGGRCRGLIHAIAPDNVESETTILWRREMVSGAYRARWVDVKTPAGTRRAIAFLINQDNQGYAGRLGEQETAHTIAFAEGRLGHCADYLRNTVMHLDELGVADGPMHRLLDRVETLQAAAAREGR